MDITSFFIYFSGWQKIALAVGVIFALQLLMEYSSYKEISWKEFFNDFLEKGAVERLEVVDKRWVRVVTRDGNSSPYTYYFNIGSVDSFERSLAAAQQHLQVEPDQQITVLYKSEFDLYVTKTLVSFNQCNFIENVNCLQLSVLLSLSFLHIIYGELFAVELVQVSYHTFV